MGGRFRADTNPESKRKARYSYGFRDHIPNAYNKPDMKNERP